MRLLVVLALAALAGCTTPFNAPAPQMQGREAPLVEPEPGLQVGGAQGLRADAASPIHALVLDVTNGPEAFAKDLTSLLVRYETGEVGTILRHDADFDVEWIAGDGDDARFEPGDRVALRLRVSPLPERTPVALWLVPEWGSSAEARFATPATYGDATVIALT